MCINSNQKLYYRNCSRTRGTMFWTYPARFNVRSKRQERVLTYATHTVPGPEYYTQSTNLIMKAEPALMTERYRLVTSVFRGREHV